LTSLFIKPYTETAFNAPLWSPEREELSTPFINEGIFCLKNHSMLWLTMVFSSLGFALLSPLSSPIAFAQQRFAPNPAPPVVPSLREWYGGSGSFTLGSSAQILLDPVYAAQLQSTALVFQQDLAAETGFWLPIADAPNAGAGTFFLTFHPLDSSLGSEGYLFDVSDAVTISAQTTNGVFYGTRTALQILHADPAHRTIPKGFARDYPSYPERGFMLDLGRKFVPLNVLEDYVRLMSWYKFNDFQLHFNDNSITGGKSPDWQHQYAAFRLNSPAFPGLAAADGSYTEAQIRELVQVAQQHAVTITPEIDTPAHSLALTQYRPDLASPQDEKDFLDLGNPATAIFVHALWQTFLPWFSTSQINMGMDEYATGDADRFRSYINASDDFFRQEGKTTRMWGSLTGMPSAIPVHTDITIEDWNNTWENPVTTVRQGFRIINANDALLYIVPHASYYHDFLDTQLLYTSWEPYIFDLNNPALNLQPGDPHLLGGTFSVWNDKLGNVVSVNDITVRIEPVLPVLGEKMWSGMVAGTDYTQFEQIVQQVGFAPNTNLML
jgi:hexosaminidase